MILKIVFNGIEGHSPFVNTILRAVPKRFGSGPQRGLAGVFEGGG